MKVLDASALLSYIFDEPGADIVERVLPESVMHTVNWAEVLSKLAEKGVEPEVALHQLEDAGVTALMRIDPGDPADALEVARLRPLTRNSGLSLGDRYCLALGQRLSVPIVTADQAWTRLELGITVESVR